MGGEIGPFFGKIVYGEDRGNGANRNTRAAIDALDGIDVNHVDFFELGLILFRMDAIYGASVYACRVFGADAGFCNYVSHINCLEPLL